MKLGEFLNKFTNADFILSVNGLCEELPFYEFENMKRENYYKEYRNRKIRSVAIIRTNERPELCVEVE